MEIYINIDSDHIYELTSDTYKYKPLLSGFKKYGIGYLEISNPQPISTAIRYESELLRTGIPDSRKRITNSYRFWTSFKHTNMWLITNHKTVSIDNKNLLKIYNYRILHIVVRLLNFDIKNYGNHRQLFIKNIYLETK